MFWKSRRIKRSILFALIPFSIKSPGPYYCKVGINQRIFYIFHQFTFTQMAITSLKFDHFHPNFEQKLKIFLETGNRQDNCLKSGRSPDFWELLACLKMCNNTTRNGRDFSQYRNSWIFISKLVTFLGSNPTRAEH